MLTGCKKELSLESGNIQSEGSLQSDVTGDCLPKTVNGAYSAGSALVAIANYIMVDVNVTSAGSYLIYTDTVNGYYFKATGVFTALGTNTVKLIGNGTPFAAGTDNFVVNYDSTVCDIAITVLPAGNTATGTLGGGPGACTPSTINGVYMVGNPLTTHNTVAIQVTVTTIGIYNITTNTVNGFSFSGSGNFSATGLQTVILNGTGTPAATGSTTFTVTFGTSTCTFAITVVPVDYYPRTTNSNWSYEYDDNPIDSFYRKVISPTHSALGNVYNIFMADYGGGLDSGGYYRKSGTDYFEYFDAGAFAQFDNPLWAEYIFVKDAAASTNWKSPAFSGTYTFPPNPPQPLSIRFSYTIIQKDVSVSITTGTTTVSYPNTIVVEEKYDQETSPGNWTDVTSAVGYGKSYYARGVGLIKYEWFDPVPTNNYQLELRRYQVF